MLYQLSYAPVATLLIPNSANYACDHDRMVETRGFEPLTSCLQSRRSTN